MKGRVPGDITFSLTNSLCPQDSLFFSLSLINGSSRAIRKRKRERLVVEFSWERSNFSFFLGSIEENSRDLPFPSFPWPVPSWVFVRYRNSFFLSGVPGQTRWNQRKRKEIPEGLLLMSCLFLGDDHINPERLLFFSSLNSAQVNYRLLMKETNETWRRAHFLFF